MRIAYRLKNDEVEVLRVWSHEDCVVIPKMIDNRPVKYIAPYAFSDHMDSETLKKEVLFFESKDHVEDGSVLRCGGRIRKIHLPLTVCGIGNYAFYGCMNMTLFHGTDRIIRMGSGVFTGCRLKEIRIDFYDGEKSCLKEILTDIRYQIIAYLNYMDADTGECKREQKILFPEFYADAVENTPARIVETHYYGSGGEYRECFYRRELDFNKYDKVFSLSGARDMEKVTSAVALMRLKYPYKLSEKSKENYTEYVRHNLIEIMGYLMDAEEENEEFFSEIPVQMILFLCKENLLDERSWKILVEEAGQRQLTEILSILMNEGEKFRKKSSKRFAL